MCLKRQSTLTSSPASAMVTSCDVCDGFLWLGVCSVASLPLHSVANLPFQSFSAPVPASPRHAAPLLLLLRFDSRCPPTTPRPNGSPASLRHGRSVPLLSCPSASHQGRSAIIRHPNRFCQAPLPHAHFFAPPALCQGKWRPARGDTIAQGRVIMPTERPACSS